MYLESEISGKLYKYENDIYTEVPRIGNNYLYVEYVNWLSQPNTVETFSGTPEEIEEMNKPKVPETISQMRLRKQLIISGISIQSIYEGIEQIPDTIQKELVHTMWEYAVVFERTDATLNQMATMLGISQEQLDVIFIEGNKL